MQKQRVVKSLFARIWASFLLVMALTLAATLAVSFALAVRRAETVNRLSPNSFTASARTALATGGVNGLSRWIVDLRHGHPELQMYFVDASGRELLSREILGKPLLGSDGTDTPRLVAPNGARYG